MRPCVRSRRRILDIWPLLYCGNRARSARFCTPLMENSPRGQSQEERFVILVEEVEAAIRARILVNGASDFVELVDAITGIVDD
jgi:hypothetical protein